MVIAALRSLFTPPAQKRAAQELYIALVEQSRKAFFYTDCGVPDTLDGRFDLLLLHVFLGLRHSGGSASGAALPQEQSEFRRLVLECLFDDMDRSLREMGVGDMGVGRRIKAMSKAAFGRLQAYGETIGNYEEFSEALRRNVYRGAEVSPAALDKLVDYARAYPDC